MTTYRTTATIDCAKCKVPLQGPANAKPDDILTCPRCGASGTVQDALGQARKQFHSTMSKELKRIIRDAGFK